MALTDKLSAIGTAIRNKTGKTALMTLDEMPTEIASITSGGEPVINPLEVTANGTYTATDCDGYSPITVNVPQDGAPTDAELTFGGNLSNWNYQGTWDDIITRYGNRITTHDVISFSQSFLNSYLTNIPFAINQKTDRNYVTYSSAFYSCKQLTTCPTINNFKPQKCNEMFVMCKKLESIPIVVDWSEANSYTEMSYADAARLFTNCERLRTIDPSWFDCDFLCYPESSIYYSGFAGCKSLDELVGLPVFTKPEWTENAFYHFIEDKSVVGQCNRLKNLTFKTNNGNPLIAKWAKQWIDFGRAGTFASESEATNLGFTEATRITDATTYQALKNNPDSWTTDLNYSRYNHDSAVATINSLPDTSAFVTQYMESSGESFSNASNLLNFGTFSTMGASTDGGAINTLTEAEIAVASSKGWTIAM